MFISSLLITFFVIYIVLDMIAKPILRPPYLFAVIIFAVLLFYKFDIIYYRIITNYFFLIIIIYWLTNKEILKIFLACFLVYLLFAFAEIIFFSVILLFDKQVTTTIWSNIGIILLASLLYYWFRDYFRKINGWHFNNQVVVGFFISFLVILLAFFIHQLYFNIPVWGHVMVALVGVIVLLSFIIIVWQERKNYLLLKDEMQKLNDDCWNFAKQIQTYRKKQHDYCNEMLYFKTIVSDEKKQLFFANKLTAATSVVETHNSSGIKGFLQQKMTAMQQLGIAATFTDQIGWSVSSDDWDFNNKVVRILANFLDNAQEACLAHHKPQVSILTWEEADQVVFLITNNYNEKVATSAMFQLLSSSKGMFRGVGLYLVQRLIAQEKDLDLRSYVVGDTCSQKLFVRKERLFKIK